MASKSIHQWERFIREAAKASERVVFTRHALALAVVVAVADDDPGAIVVTAMEL